MDIVMDWMLGEVASGEPAGGGSEGHSSPEGAKELYDFFLVSFGCSTRCTLSLFLFASGV
jgi:hypothetical protein